MGNWHKELETALYRAVALWGAEIAWRGQQAWRCSLERLQYQALRKCTGAVIGADMYKVNKLAGVEGVDMILGAAQTRFMARCIGDPSMTDGIWEPILALQTGRRLKGKSYRHWTDHGIKWLQSEVVRGWDGYATIADHLLGRIEVGIERKGVDISWRCMIEKVTCMEVDLLCTEHTSVTLWQEAIDAVGCTTIYTDGSMSKDGTVGGGYYFQQGSLGFRVGLLATVWDGGIAGLERGLRAAGDADQVLMLADSKAAIKAIVTAGRTGNARTRALGALGTKVKRRKDLYGADAVRFGWVKAHVGISGNEGADAMAKH